MGKLKEQLLEKSNKSKSVMTPEIKKVMDKSLKKLKKQAFHDNSLDVGDVIPDIILMNHENNLIDVNEMIKDGPVVITFYRGGWCPYCNLELMAYQELIDEFDKLGVKIVAISPESPERTEVLSKKIDLGFEVLSDRDNKVAKQFGIVYEYDENLKKLYTKFGINLEEQNGSWELPIPATYLIDAQGKVVMRSMDEDYTVRLDPEDILEYLKKYQH